MTIKIFYTDEDLNIADIDEESLIGIYFWNITSEEWEVYNDTGVNITNQNGYEGYCWANAYHLTLLSIAGEDKTPPSKVTGLTVIDMNDGILSLSFFKFG